MTRKRSRPDHSADQQHSTAAADKSKAPAAEKPAEKALTKRAKREKDNQGSAGVPPPAPAPPTRGRRSTRSSGAATQEAKGEAAAEPVPAEAAAAVPAAVADPAQPKLGSDSKPEKAVEAAERAMAGRHDEDEIEKASSSALQGLLRKLGAGFDESMMGMGMMGGGRFKGILASLKQAEDEGSQLGALTELCELLSISSEDNLAAFPVETAMPMLVNALSVEHNSDIMLLGARALTFMADMLPASCSSIVRHGAVPLFCQRLLTIEYIDLAEQSLQALEKLSYEHSSSLLQHGGLLAVLSYLDFFPTGVQRVAVATAANMCRGLGAENASAVREAVPMLVNLLQYQDSQVVDSACMALSNVAESYANRPALLGILSTGGLITQALQLVALSESGSSISQLSLSTYYSLLKLLSMCASKAPAVAQQLLEGGLLDVLRTLLATSALLPGGAPPGAGASMLRSPDQLYEVMVLLCQLLPPVVDSVTLVSEGRAVTVLPGGTDERALFYEQTPAAMKQASGQVLPLLLQLYSASVVPQVRQQCLGAMLRVLAAAPVPVLLEALRDLAISSFVASLLNTREVATQAAGLHLAEILMMQLPEIFRPAFLKEGVVFAVEQLISKATTPTPNLTVAAPATASAGKAGAVLAAPPVAGAGKGGASAAVVTPPSPSPSATVAPAAEVAGVRRVTRSSSRHADPVPSGIDAGLAAGSVLPPSAPTIAAVIVATSTPAAAVAVPAPTPVTPAPAASLRSRLVARATAFRAQHFASAGGALTSGGALETEGMRALRTACTRLGAQPAALADILELLSGGPDGMAGVATSGVSVFELINSGAVAMLGDFLQGKDLPTGAPHNVALLRRLRDVVRVGLAPDSGTHPPLTILVCKLQGALASLESFPVVLTRVVSGAGGSVGGGAGARHAYSHGAMQAGGGGSGYGSGLAALSQPFKLRLARHSTESHLRDYGSNVVLIEPLASMSAIEDFLFPRVYRSASTTSPPTGAAGSSAAALGALAQAQQALAASASALGPAGAKAKKLAAPAGHAGSSAARPAPSRAQPIPERGTEGEGSQRRVTRAAAAARARTIEPAVPIQSPVPEDVAMLDEEAAMLEYAQYDDDEEGHTMDGDEDGPAPDDEDMVFDEEYDDEEGAHEEEGPMGAPVHDLLVEEALAAAEAAAGRGIAQAAELAAAAAAAVAEKPATRASAAAAANPSGTAAVHASALGALARAAAPPGSAWGGRGAGVGASAQGEGAPASVRSEQPRLAFFSGTHHLASSATVFQGIQQLAQTGGHGQGEPGGEDNGDGTQPSQPRSRMWDGIYTLHYRTPTAEDLAPPVTPVSLPPAGMAGQGTGVASDGSVQGLRAAAGAGVPTGALMPLQTLSALSLPSDLVTDPVCADVLRLLKVLEAVNRLGARMCAAAEAEEAAGAEGARTAGGCSYLVKGKAQEVEGLAPVYGRMSREDFVCSKLSSKLAQQLKDVLAICGGGLPSWCRQLVISCKHLFPFEMRRRYFYCTALGLGRALHHIQALHSSEAGGTGGGGHGDREAREARVGRLQRQKVRVSRKRILESALKVFELYSNNRSVLELEYFGEVGTGLGPTLEFYTLLSHDLQRRSLKLWRHEEPAPDTVEEATLGVDDLTLDSTPLDAKPKLLVPGQLPRVPSIVSVGQGQAPAAAAHMHVEAWHDDTEYVNAPWGLFPVPLAPADRKAASKPLEHFKLVGRAVAKALQDSRLMDLPLNYAFYRAVFNRPLDMQDISCFDPQLGTQLHRLCGAVATAQAAQARASPDAVPTGMAGGGRGRAQRTSNNGAPARRTGRSSRSGSKADSPVPVGLPLGSVLLDGVAVEDLCLNFTLPGYPEYNLVEGGDEKMVDSSNLRQWIDLVVDATIGSGIASQMTAFRAGFSEVFPLSSLDIFEEDEVETLLCGAGEHWSVQLLSKAIKFDHGYSPSSPVVMALLEVLAELDAQDQRRFLRFVTGCPRLPPGGLGSLHPRLTVVRKQPSGESSGSMGVTPVGSLKEAGVGTTLADGDLPSVMTCANYIKLPPYSCKRVLRERLLFAVCEGQGSFDLS